MDEIATMLHRLETGFPITIDGRRIRCRAFVVHAGVDYQQLNSMTNVRGVNAWFPCVYCLIGGIKQTAHDNTTHYYPLAFPYDIHHGQVRAADPPVNARVVPWRLPPAVHYQPGDLPLRADPIYRAHLDDMAQAQNNQAQEDIGKATGLNGPAAFRILEFCKNPFRYAIVDPFHLLCENVIPNLWKIFAGTLKPMSPANRFGEMLFLLARQDVAFVNECLKLNGKYIPSSFGRNLREICGGWKGSEWMTFGFRFALPLYYHAWGPNPDKLVFTLMYSKFVQGICTS
ncbi:hypothetical protein BCR44DRAFT_403172 [Catenaria anguillulae PL171]|uniref:Uncharacterized protein n=1 Tax=Catenaria anguillulae PL171 TaxID=765915 RepID=A0A1Y2I435_9FUNG|nr:hypothetical protein BCR44DRAFT_403172 [Catenaria anguillulae PL171]